MVSNLQVYLETQKQIKFNKINIYQISLNEILDFGIEEYNMLLLPFLLDIDDFEILNKDLLEDINIFDILTLDERTLSMLLNSISMFCKTDEIAFDEQKKILYIGDGYISKDNFAEFSDIILKINSKQKIIKEKPPENMTEKQEEIWKKLQQGRQRAMAKSQIELADLINVCQFGGEYYIPTNDILQWSLYNITRCYKTILGKTNFRESFEIYCVTGEDKLINNKHWTDLIKLENDNKEEQI
jgi:hypothetical protein